MYKPPTGFKGDTGTGALTGLKSVGPQEDYLYSKKRKPVGYKHKQHTEGLTYYKIHTPILSANVFGQEFKYVLNPKEMGHLLTGLFFSFYIPGVKNSRTTGMINIGYTIFDRISLLVNGEEIQSMTGEYMANYESMYSREIDRINTMGLMGNMGYGYDLKLRFMKTSDPQRIFVPIPFFFSNHYDDNKMDTNTFRSPLPLCALYNSTVTIVFRFKERAKVYSDIDDLASDEITNLNIITQEVTLSPEERENIKNKKQTFPIEKIIQENFEVPVKIIRPDGSIFRETKFRYYFNSSYSCRAIFWTFIEKSDSYAPDYYAPIVDTTINTLERTNRSDVRPAAFYQQFQAYTHDYHNNGYIYAYSFSERPLQVVLGDYEFKAPSSQSAYIDCTFKSIDPGYVFWDEVARPSDIELSNEKVILNQSLSIINEENGIFEPVNNMSLKNESYLRTNLALLGIPFTAYESQSNDEDPYYIRFVPWGLTYTRSGMAFTPSVESYYVNSSGLLQIKQIYNGIFSPVWSTLGNTEAWILVEQSVGDPLWGNYVGNIYSLTEDAFVAIGTTAAWSSEKGYPADQGDISATGNLDIDSGSKMNLGTKIKEVETYIVSFYYISTVGLSVGDGKMSLT